ncbi:MAG: pesticin C-terminus-like muramidase [Thalassobaculaceae bacterium]|nr:pesticin C-terminus-like muramidase [Thalassobaculaceae bacterium]
MADRIDYVKMRDFEGFNLQGHRPNTSQSGVTVGMGIDLGQRNDHDLRRAGLSREEYERLSPFLGLKGTAADDALAAYKKLYGEAFAISEATWEKLKADYIRLKIEPMISLYNRSLARDRLSFDRLPVEVQTVIASVTWQYGTPLLKTPTFWAHAVDQDWSAALAELRNFKDNHQTRHTKEADYMEPAVIRLRSSN